MPRGYLLILFLCAVVAGGEPHSYEEHVRDLVGLSARASRPHRNLLADAYYFAGKFGSHGDGTSQFTQLLWGLAVASLADGGAVYIVDCSPSDDGSLPCAVKVFTREGDYLLTIGGPGQGPGQFLYASGVAVLNGRLYVSDISTEQPRVSVFNATTGAYLFAFGSPGSGGGQMAEPYALTTSGGMLYVVDRNLNRVTVFDGQGKYIKHWGNPDPSADEDPNAPPTSAPGQFDAPCGVAAAESGDVFVLDCGNFRVQQFTAMGDFIRQWGSFGTDYGQFTKPRGIAAVGTWVFTLDGTPRIQRFSAGTGSLQLAWGTRSEAAPAPPSDGTMKSPFAIALDETGMVYVQDNGNFRLQKFFNPTTVPHGNPPIMPRPPPSPRLPLNPAPKAPPPPALRRPPPKPQANGLRRPPPAPLRRPPQRKWPPPPVKRPPPPPVKRPTPLPQCRKLNQQCSAAAKCCGQLTCRAAQPRICVGR